jgi:hypothetical protein
VDEHRVYEGEARDSYSIQEALDDAIGKARADWPCSIPDDMLQWTVEEISGSYGGFSGGYRTRVTISATCASWEPPR